MKYLKKGLIALLVPHLSTFCSFGPFNMKLEKVPNIRDLFFNFILKGPKLQNIERWGPKVQLSLKKGI